jgi:hypothetical protein
MGAVGLPELLLVFVLAAFWIVPLAAAAWALVTLYRIRGSQDAIQRKLDTIERLMHRAPSA